jgi:excisionase family DNA binding protein
MEIYLTIEELAVMLKLSEQTIRRYVLNRVIPYRKIRTAIRFRLSEIEKWIDGGCTDNVEDLLCGEKADEADDDLLNETSDSPSIDEGAKETE